MDKEMFLSMRRSKYEDAASLAISCEVSDESRYIGDRSIWKGVKYSLHITITR